MFSTCLSYFLCLLMGCCRGYNSAMDEIHDINSVPSEQIEFSLTENDIAPIYLPQYWGNRGSNSSLYEYDLINQPSSSGS